MTSSRRQDLLCPLLALAALPMTTAAAQGTDPFDPTQINELEITYTEDLGGIGAGFWHTILNAYTPFTEADVSTTAELRVNDETETYPIEVEYRGNSSYLFTTSTCGPYPRKPLKLKAVDDDWAGVERMRFNVTASFLDLSFMHEVLAREILGRFTMAPRNAFVRLSMGPNYFMDADEYLSMGTYLYHESIDKQFESRRLLGNEGIRFAITGPEQAADWSTPEQTQDGFHQLGSGNDDPCTEAEAAYFGEWDGVLPGPDTDTDCEWEELYGIGWVLANLEPGTEAFAVEMEKHLDVDQMMWALAAWHVIGDTDRMQGRFLEDSEHGRMVWIPYDISHSIDPNGINAFASGNPFLSPVDFTQKNVLRDALMDHPEYRARYQHHVRLAFREAFTPAQFACLGETYREIVTAGAGTIEGQDCPAGGYVYPPLASDPALAVLENGLVFDGPDNNGWLKTLADYTSRHGELAGLPGAVVQEPWVMPLPISPTRPVAGQPTVVTVMAFGTQFPAMPEMTLRWRTEGAYERVPMFDDGMGADLVAGDFRFTAEIPPQSAGSVVQYYVQAYDDAGADPVMTFFPERGACAPETFHVATGWADAEVVINEILADEGDGSEFIEIYNAGSSAVDISGWVLDDDDRPGIDDENDDRFVFPDGTTIEPGQHFVVWGNGGGPGWVAPFGLKAKGETVVLAMPDAVGNPLSDVYRYHRGFRGVSVGRVRDGKDAWQDFADPTPAGTNGLAGDLNGDGVVTVMDLTQLLIAFGTCGIDLPGDLNGDLIIDELDVDIFVAIF